MFQLSSAIPGLVLSILRKIYVSAHCILFSVIWATQATKPLCCLLLHSAGVPVSPSAPWLCPCAARSRGGTSLCSLGGYQQKLSLNIQSELCCMGDLILTPAEHWKNLTGNSWLEKSSSLGQSEEEKSSHPIGIDDFDQFFAEASMVCLCLTWMRENEVRAGVWDGKEKALIWLNKDKRMQAPPSLLFIWTLCNVAESDVALWLLHRNAQGEIQPYSYE